MISRWLVGNTGSTTGLTIRCSTRNGDDGVPDTDGSAAPRGEAKKHAALRVGLNGLEPYAENEGFLMVSERCGAPGGAPDVFPAELWGLLDSRARSAVLAAARALAWDLAD